MPPLAAVQAAYDNAHDRTGGVPISPPAMVTRTFFPAYTRVHGAITAGAGVTITLDAQNVADAVFIFQVNGALTMAANTHMLLTNRARAKNVFWQVLGGFGVGANSSFVGTVLRAHAVDIGKAASSMGECCPRTARWGLNDDQIYFPSIDVTITSGPYAILTSTPTSHRHHHRRPQRIKVTVTVQGQAAHPRHASRRPHVVVDHAIDARRHVRQSLLLHRVVGKQRRFGLTATDG